MLLVLSVLIGFGICCWVCWALLRFKKLTSQLVPAIDAQGESKTVPVPRTMRGQIQIETPNLQPLSVNYHFLRTCNYKCKFCFHTAKDFSIVPLEEAKRGLELLRDAGMKKINFSGGEPFLKKEHLGILVRFCKESLHLAVSIVSNGSLVTEKWMNDYGPFLDILAISCDSFNEETNIKIGRHANRIHHVNNLKKIRSWCRDRKILFKINTVVNSYNIAEDMSAQITALAPVRWKVFQCLLIDGENAGPDALRDAQDCVVTDAQFKQFCDKHRELKCFVPESNTFMRDSYLILDEHMRFLDCTGGAKKPSKSILEVGVDAAIARSGFDEKMFVERGGKYQWKRSDLEW